MKNAFVLVDHLGDDGTVTVGMILKELSVKRFDHLEKRGLIREATSEEVKTGYKPPFTAEKTAPTPSNKKAPEPANKGA